MGAVSDELLQLKWAVLAFASLITMGNYFLYDLPGSVGTGTHHSVEAHFRHHGVPPYTQEMNQLLYSFYSWPSMVMALLGGIFIDRVLGLYRTMLYSSLCVLLGAAFFQAGVANRSYTLLVVSRVAFGLGGEPQVVAQYAFVARWFTGKWGVAIAFATVTAVQRAGAACAFWLAPNLAYSFGIDTVGVAAVLISAFSIASFGVVYLLDRLGVRRGVVPEQVIPERTEAGAAALFRSFEFHRVGAALLLMALYNALVSAAVYGFLGVSKNYFEVQMDVGATTAANYTTLFFLVVVVAAPLLGAVVDVTGRFITWMFFSAVLSSAAVMAFAFTPFVSPQHFVILLGLFQAGIVCSHYPAIPFAAAPDMEGIAFGLVISAQNVGVAAATWVNGVILDHYTLPICGAHQKPGAHCSVDGLPSLAGYRLVIVILSVYLALGGVVCVGMYLVDCVYGGGVLNAAPAGRDVIVEMRAKEAEADAADKAALVGKGQKPPTYGAVNTI
jgi:MFS family permease